MAEQDEQAQRDGYYRVLTLGATHILFRWDVLLCIAVYVLLALQGSRAVPAAFAAWIALLILHEAGHALAARAFGAQVHGVFIHLFGGLCRFAPLPKLWQSAVVYGAGALAQLAVLVPALGWLALHGFPRDPAEASALAVLSAGNAYLIAASLVPRTLSKGLKTDGLLLRQLYLHAYRGGPHPFPRPVVLPQDQAPVFDPGVNLLTMPELVPQGFVTGIALYNDAATPMDFVVGVLARHLGLEQDAALRLMLDIHNKGGGIVPLSSLGRAEEIVAAIMAEAQQAGHPFTCRAVKQGTPHA